jgi:hypothetical protein
MNCGPTPCVERPPHLVSVSENPAGAGWILAATVLGSSMEFIDGTVVNVALPSLQSSFGAAGTQVQWVVEAYALFLSAMGNRPNFHALCRLCRSISNSCLCLRSTYP